MARRKNGRERRTLEGAERFAGPDAEKEAIEKIAAAKAAAEKEAAQDKKTTLGDNGGPPLDQGAWTRAVNEYTAEMLSIEDLESQRSEIAGRISSIRKVAKKLGVDWDLVKRYYDEHKRIRKGSMGSMVTEERRYRWLLKVMSSPLGTQFNLWDVPSEEEGAGARPGMDAELQGQHAYSNDEPLTNNPFDAASDVERHNDWRHGWTQAQNAKARSMAPAAAH
jgi:hypothetical protein